MNAKYRFRDHIAGFKPRIIKFVSEVRELSLYLKVYTSNLLKHLRQRARTVFDMTLRFGVATTKISLLSLLLFFVVMSLIIFVVSAFLFVCFTSAATTRYLLLRNLPGTEILPLFFNVMPLETEWWRGNTMISAAVLEYPLNYAYGSTPPPSLTEKASNLRISTFNNYADCFVASSTVLFPSHNKPKEVYTKGGKVSYNSLFNGGKDPFFTMDGEYSGAIQLVFLKEEVGTETSMVVEFSMLYSEEDRWTLSSLDVLFHGSHSFNVCTGPPERSFLRTIYISLFEFFFYVPLKLYRYFYYCAFDYANGPFPNIDHRREIAVTVPLYKGFTPPYEIRPHLAAMNFTLFQQRENKQDRRVRISRWMYQSRLKLSGLAAFLHDYPFLSFIVLTIIYAGTYTTWLFALVSGGAVFVYIQKKKNNFAEYEGEEPPAFGDAREESDTEPDLNDEENNDTRNPVREEEEKPLQAKKKQ